MAVYSFPGGKVVAPAAAARHQIQRFASGGVPVDAEERTGKTVTLTLQAP